MRTKKLKIPYTEQLNMLNAASAAVWGECLTLSEVWCYAHGSWGYFPNINACELWMDKQLTKSQPLHSQSIQEVRSRYFKNWKAFRALRRNGDKTARPPYREKFYQTTTWKKSAISFKKTNFGKKQVLLSNGRGNEPLVVDLPKKFDIENTPAIVNLVFNKGQYELHFVYKIDDGVNFEGKGVVGVDIGEIHPMVSYDGVNTLIFNGRYIRSLYRLRNKVIASMDAKIDKCKRHSQRWWHLVRRKWKRIKKIDNQIYDGLHKHTTKFVRLCHSRDIGAIVIGDLIGIRDTINYGKRVNQKLHQWAFGKVTQMITYKAKALGIKVEVIDEAYTSQTCPGCGDRHKSNARSYTCKCGFQYHRDGVGAINIRRKYLGCLGAPVVAAMAPPVGFRLEVQCCSA
ncbi:MAG: transposase [Candidatus Poribacteria bacterium]|nr:transposase [Candidatus Poribacteria bacterium]